MKHSGLVGQTDFQFEFALGEKVIVDKDDRLTLMIIAIQVNPEAILYKLSWFADGRHIAEWFDAFRITSRRDQT